MMLFPNTYQLTVRILTQDKEVKTIHLIYQVSKFNQPTTHDSNVFRQEAHTHMSYKKANELQSMSGTFEVSLGNHWIASLMQRVRRAWCRVQSISHIAAFLMLYHTEIWCRERNLEGIRMQLDFQTTLPNELLHGACGERGVSPLS